MCFDGGPATVAFVGESDALLAPLAPEVVLPEASLRVLKRAIDRSCRANNPANCRGQRQRLLRSQGLEQV
jgi:hypothetical protein